MSTDDFTMAARQEAWRQHPAPVDVETGEPVDDWGFEERGREDFMAGAEWARTYLAQQEPTDAISGAFEKYAITIPDALGYKVPAVTVEDLLDVADEY